MALLIYLPPVLVIQYIIILITLNSIYIILLFVNKQWGTILFDGSTTEKNITLPINFSIILGFSTFAYGQGVHSVFGGYHQPPNGISMYRKSFFAENVNCIWLGVFK